MIKQAQARLNMNYAVLLTLKKYADAVNTIPAFTKLAGELKENVQQIEETMMLVEANNEGVTDKKRNIRLELALQTGMYCGVLVSYAAENDLAELKKKAGERPSALKVMSAGKLLLVSRMVLKEMQSNLAGLESYTITAGTITEYEAQIGRLAKDIAAPKHAGSSKKAMREQLRTLIKRNRHLHNERMTPLMQMYRKSYPSFFIEYRENSKIRSPYTNHTRAEGVITDLQTGEKLAGVVIKAPGTSFTTKTDRKGAFKLYITEKGTYTLTFEKPGYQLYEQKEVEINIGQATAVNAALGMVDRLTG